MAIDLYPHQTRAVREMHNGSILQGGVGTGKSRTALTYYFTKECGGRLRINGAGDYRPMEDPKDLYIITTAKKRDLLEWEAEAAPFGISTEPTSSLSGKKLVVDSWNNIGKYEDVKDAFFILDEQRLIGSGSWVRSFLRIAKANRWVMLSATPGDGWLDYIGVFVANGFYKNRTEFLRRHVVYNNFSKFPKIDHFVETGHLERLRRSILVDMPYERHTVRHVQNILVTYDKELYEDAAKKRWHVYESRPIRNIVEYFVVLRKLVNSDVSRIGAVLKLMEKHPKLIIFYNFNYELDMLRTLGTTCDIPIGEWNGHKHEDIPDGDRWLYLVQYTAGSEGWNCTSTNAVVFWSLNYSFRINEQSKGRIERLNTAYTDLYYYILRSGSSIDQAITKALLGKKNFNENKFVGKVKWPDDDDRVADRTRVEY